MIKRFYWSSSAIWYINDSGQLIINNHIYNEKIAELFPDFYYVAVQGSLTTQLLCRYKGYDANMIRTFIKSLLEENILVFAIDDIVNIFNAQSRLFTCCNSTLAQDIKINADAKENFTKASLRREVTHNQVPIKLQNIPIADSNILSRKTTRKFSESDKVSFQQLSELLSILRERIVNNCSQYNFASGGGLYPIDYYIYIKDNRVEKLPHGIYLYVPYTNELQIVSVPTDNFKEAHYFGNQDIFESSAFSIFLIYNASYSMPKYEGLGYYLGIVDSGIISHALSVSAEACSLGSCIIGEMNFNIISNDFKLSNNQKYLHCIEFGSKLKEAATNDIIQMV